MVLKCQVSFDKFQGNVTEYEFSHEEFRQLQIEFWSKFYAYCLQYQEELSRPLALLLNQYTNMVCLLKKVRSRLFQDQALLKEHNDPELYCVILKQRLLSLAFYKMLSDLCLFSKHSGDLRKEFPDRTFYIFFFLYSQHSCFAFF